MAESNPSREREGPPDRDREAVGAVRSSLARLARPHAEHACWIDPEEDRSGGAVLLLGRRTGLLVIPVRAWTTEELVSATSGAFQLSSGGERRRRLNPDREGRERAEEIREALKGVGVESGVPVAHAVAFPSMARAEFVRRGFHWFIPVERALFREDFEPEGDLEREVSGARFRERISGAFPRRPAAMSTGCMDRILQALHPEASIRKTRGERERRTRFREGVSALDASQDLYGRRSSWENLGIRARGHTRRLRHVYRNTAEIFEFGRRFLGRQPLRRRQPAVLPEPWPFRGPIPVLERFESADELLASTAGEIRARLEKEGRDEEIAFIRRMRETRDVLQAGWEGEP